MNGQIYRVISGFYDVINDKNENIRLTGAGILRKQNISPLVGDFVEYNESGNIISVLPRKNFLIRPKVANIDQVVIVASISEPIISDLLIDKFLAIVESQNIKPIIIFTKIDLIEDNISTKYEALSYEVYKISNIENIQDINTLKVFENKLSVFTGQSGAGKSSTINNLFNTNIETQKISKFLGRGKHTTRVTEIHYLNNCKIIDTPGFSSFDINLSPLEFSKSFYDFKLLSKDCQFNNCLHIKEENCKIKSKYLNDDLIRFRYENYLILNKKITEEKNE